VMKWDDKRLTQNPRFVAVIIHRRLPDPELKLIPFHDHFMSEGTILLVRADMPRLR